MTPTRVPEVATPRPEMQYSADQRRPRKRRSLELFPYPTSAGHGNKSRYKHRENAGHNFAASGRWWSPRPSARYAVRRRRSGQRSRRFAGSAASAASGSQSAGRSFEYRHVRPPSIRARRARCTHSATLLHGASVAGIDPLALHEQVTRPLRRSR
jgi:hypothetical protein